MTKQNENGSTTVWTAVETCDVDDTQKKNKYTLHAKMLVADNKPICQTAEKQSDPNA